MNAKIAIGTAALLVFAGSVGAETIAPPAAVQSLHGQPPLMVGTAGYLDPSTGSFKPLQLAGPAAQPFEGTVHVILDLHIDAVLRSENDNVTCEVQIQFGNIVNGTFFADQGTRAQVTFAATTPPAEIDLPYVYQPTGAHPMVGGQVECQGSGGSRAAKLAATRGSTPAAPPEGDLTLDRQQIEIIAALALRSGSDLRLHAVMSL